MSAPMSIPARSSCTKYWCATSRDAGRRGTRCARAAAESLEVPRFVAPQANRTNNWVAGPTELFFERVVEGELPESEYATVVEEIRRVLRNAGQVSQFGRSFSWIAARGPAIRRDLEVAVS